MGNGILNFKRVAVIYDDSFLLSRFERESGGERKKKVGLKLGWPGSLSLVFRRFPIDSKGARHFPHDGLADCYLSISSLHLPA